MKNTIGKKLKRNVSFLSAVSVSMGTMIGAGIFVLPGIAMAKAGSGAIISFAIAGFVALTTALSASELVSGMPKAGGSYHIINRSLGPALGSVAGWGSWVGLVLKGSFAVVGFAYYFAVFAPVSITITAVVAIIFLAFINILGAKESGMAQVLIVASLLIILSVFTGWGLSEVNFSYYEPFIPYGWGSVFAVAGLVFVSYVGLIKILAIAEEIESPRETIPKAIILSTVLIIVLYVLIMFVVAGVAPHGFFAKTDTPVVDAARIFMGNTGMAVLVFAGLLATISTGNAVILCSPRYLFAMGRDGLLPEWLSEVHERFHTPYKSILVTAGAMILLVIFVDVMGLVKLGSAFNLIIFGLINISVMLIRHNKPLWFKPSFRSPGYPFVQILGLFSSLALVPAMGLMPTIVCVLFFVGGLGWYYLWRDRTENKSVASDISRTIKTKMALWKANGFADGLENEKDGESYKVLLLLRGSKFNKNLISIACSIAKRNKGTILAVKVVEPSPPKIFRFLRTVFGSGSRRADKMLVQVERHCQKMGVGAEGKAISTHISKRRILEVIKEESCNLIITEHIEELGKIETLENVLGWIMQHAFCDVVVFKDGGGKKIKNMLVSTPIGPYAEFTVSVANTVAEFLGAKITFFRVINPRANKEEVKTIEEYQKKLASNCSVFADVAARKSLKLVDEIVRETEKFDLLVISASGDWVFKSIVFGSISDEVVERVKSSVIVIRRGIPKHISWLRRVRYTIWRPSKFDW